MPRKHDDGDPQSMNVEWWSIERPVAYARNARKIPQRAIEKVAASLKEFGWRQCIVVDAQGVIVVGHCRLLAAKSLGMAQVPVHVAADLTPAQCKAYRLMDNRSHEETDWDLDLLGPEILDLKMLDFDLNLTGFDLPDLGEIVFPAGPKSKKEQFQNDELAFKIIVDCIDEQHQSETLAKFKTEGFKCRPLIS
jgi:ParB-like nuclease family protein